MKVRLFGLLAVLIVCTVWFFLSPIIGLSRLGNAVATKNVAAIDERVDFTRLGRSLAPQIVWGYLNKTGRAKMLGGIVSSMVAGGSASLADPILGDMLNPEAVLRLLDAGQPGGKLQVSYALAALPNGNFGSFWQAFQSADYGIGNFYVRLPPSAATADQYRLHMEVLRWNWKLVGIDLPERVKDQLVDELIRRIGG